MSYLVGWRCSLCGTVYAPDQVTYTCPRCGDSGILDALYNYPAIAREVPRAAVQASGEGSHWRYRPLLPLPENAIFPPLQVGWTPLYAAPRLAQAAGVGELWVKDEGRNPTGSLKDRASALVLAIAAARGEAVVTTASTGNAAAALAGLAASTGQQVVIFVPESAPPAKIAQLLAYGARVLLVRGNYDAAYDLCLEAARAFGWYCRNTAYNPYTAEGKKTAAFEIAEQLGWNVPDWVVVPVGDGNIITALHRGFQDLAALGWIDRVPRLLAVQAAGSAAVHNAWAAGRGGIEPVKAHPGLTASLSCGQPVLWPACPVARHRGTGAQGTGTLADSIAVDLPRDGVRALRAIRQTGGASVLVSDQEILDAIPALARGCGVFAEPAAAAAYAGLCRAVAAGIIGAQPVLPGPCAPVPGHRTGTGARAVVLVTGNGLKDIASVRRAVAEPAVIEPHLAAVADEISRSGLPVQPALRCGGGDFQDRCPCRGRRHGQ